MGLFGHSGPLLILFLIATSFTAFGQVYFENFSDEANGATSGTSVGGTWTTTTPSGGAASFSRFDVGAPYGGILLINNTVNEGVWRTNVLDISALGEVALEVLMGGDDATAADYVRAYYVIDGGAEVLFGEVLGAPGLVIFTASSAVVSGSTLQIVIRGSDNSGGGFMGFDDVRVTDITVLYSRANSAWNLGTTWSTVGLGGASCGCTPNVDSRVVIGNSNTVTFPVAGSAAGVEIRNTGVLQYTANNLALSITRGGAVDIQSGGTLTRLATTGSTIAFGNYTYNINVAGTLSIGALVFNSSGNSVLNNTGTVTLGTATGLVINTSNGYTFNNSGTFSLAAMDLNTNDITFNNSGTVNQTGNFTDVDAGSTFNNLSNGTWNFGGTVITGVRLFANNNSNTFNYNGGAQNIITPQDAYSNIRLSGNGAKVAGGDFSVNGDWRRSPATATFSNGGFRVTFSGNIPQIIIAAAGETFANMTINSSSASSPQIVLNNGVTVSGNLTMLDGNVGLGGNMFNITSSAATALTHDMTAAAGWMYGGILRRAIPSTAITTETVAGYFPLGGASDSRPFFFGKSDTPSSNGTISIVYNDAATVTDITFADGAAVIQRRHDGYWAITKAGAAAGTFDITGGGTGFTIANVNQTRLTRASDALAIGTAAASGGTPADVRVRRTGLLAAQIENNFYVASTDMVNSPLPIELLYFRARIQGDEVVTTWKTAQEENNHYFTVEKTADLETFYEAGRVDGRGNSAEAHSYSFVDHAPFTGRSYYRLKQTDFDGKFTVSGPVMIDYARASPILEAYPNPFDGKNFTLEIKGVSGVSTVKVILYNQQGQKILEIPVDEDGPGIFKKEVLFQDYLAPGLYFLKAGKTLQLTSKVVVR